MNKNGFNYNEGKHSDSYEDVVDIETGAVPVKKSTTGKTMKDLLQWANTRRGFPIINVPKQFTAMKKMREANISPAEIKQRWVELEAQEFYKQHGLDFMMVCSSFDKKR